MPDPSNSGAGGEPTRPSEPDRGVGWWGTAQPGDRLGLWHAIATWNAAPAPTTRSAGDDKRSAAVLVDAAVDALVAAARREVVAAIETEIKVQIGNIEVAPRDLGDPAVTRGWLGGLRDALEIVLAARSATGGLHLPECNAGCIGDSHVLLGSPHGEPFGHQ